MIEGRDFIDAIKPFKDGNGVRCVSILKGVKIGKNIHKYDCMSMSLESFKDLIEKGKRMVDD